MADNSALGNIAGELKDQLGDRVDPGKMLSEANLKKKRGAFWTCLIAAALLVLLALAGSIAYNATRVSLFRDAVNQHVVAAGLISQSDADAFVNDTLDYLTGIKTVWEPAITVGDHRIGVPETFKAHMATVKGWVENAKAVLLAGAAIVLLLLSRAMVGVKGARRGPFSVGGYYLGAAIPLMLIAGVGLWGYLNFDGLWDWVHRTLIPDGIFDAGEEIMQLFPVSMFASYLKPVAITFGIGAAIVLALPAVLWPLSRLLTNLLGKKGASGGGSSGSTGRRTAARRTTAAAGKTAARKTAAKKTGGAKTSRKASD